jgi:23S rRNA pseudouridine1911/1915/1917 synthase
VDTWHTVATDRGDIGTRIDRVLLRHLAHVPGATRNRLQRLIANGAVRVNGRIVTRVAMRVGAADVIAIEWPARKPRTAVVAEDRPLHIFYEDEQLLIVNKPAGLVSHPANRHPCGTLLNGLFGYARQRWTPSLVSRLDKGTSGLVLVAKTTRMHTALQRLSSDNAIEKDYLAVVQGKPPLRGTIDLALDRDPWDARRVAVRDRGGVPSVTTFRRLRYVTIGPARLVSLLRCRLITGRMHQIRVHLAAKGWPILGDVTYGIKFPGLDRQALHAARLAFVHPGSAVRVEVSAPLPADMAALLERIEMSEVGQHGPKR